MARRTNRVALARALVVSLILHASFSPLFVRSSLSSALGTRDGSANGEIVAEARVAHLSFDRPRPRIERRLRPTQPREAVAVARPARSAVVRAAAPRDPPRAAVAPDRSARIASVDSGVRPAHRSPRDAPRAGARGERGRRSPLALTLATDAPERLAAGDAPTPGPRTIALPAPRPTPAPPVEARPSAAAATATPSAQLVARGDVPPGGWGQTFERPLVADEATLDDLRTRYPGTHAIRIDVDEAGRAVRVTLPGGMTPDARAALVRELMDLRYVPAECNGLRCTGILQLSL